MINSANNPDYAALNSNTNLDQPQPLINDLDQHVRAAFIKKVFLIVVFQLSVTMVMVILSVTVPGYAEFQRDQQWLMWVLFSVAICVQISLICFRKLTKLVPYNYLLLTGFALCQGYIVGYIAAEVGQEAGNIVVLISVIITLVLTIALTLYAYFFPTNFRIKWAVALCISVTLCFLGLFSIFFASRVLELVIGSLVLCLVSIYMVIDIQLIMGRKGYGLSIDEYILGAMLLYVDIITIFVEILAMFKRD